MVPGPLEQDPGHRAVPVRDGRPIPRSRKFVLSTKGAVCRRRATTSHDFWTALVEEPKAQLHRLRNTALDVAQFSITLRRAGTSGEKTKKDHDRVGSFRPGRERPTSATLPPRADQDGERYPRLRSAPREGDEERDGLARMDAKETEQQENAGVALQMLENAAEFLLGITLTSTKRCETSRRRHFSCRQQPPPSRIRAWPRRWRKSSSSSSRRRSACRRRALDCWAISCSTS